MEAANDITTWVSSCHVCYTMQQAMRVSLE